MTDGVEMDIGRDPTDADENNDGVVDGRERAEAAEPVPEPEPAPEPEAAPSFGTGADLVAATPERPMSVDSKIETPDEPDLIDAPDVFTKIEVEPTPIAGRFEAAIDPEREAIDSPDEATDILDG